MISLLCSIRDYLFKFWSWVSRNFVQSKIFIFFTLTVASIRAAVALMGTIYTKVCTIKEVATVTGSTMASSGSASSSFLDKANAVVPVGETLAFLAAYGAIAILTTAYMFVRSLYKAVPLKAT